VRIPIVIDYISRNNKIETLTLALSLTAPVANASARETIDEIRQRAPQQFYTQNRMVNGEDYNILPYAKFSNVLKSKAVNRTSSGISRYLDIIDPTGKHSTTNVFGDDAIAVAENTVESFSFSYNNANEVLNMIGSQLRTIMASRTMIHFYHAYTSRVKTNLVWQLSTVGTNQCTGFFRLPNRDQPHPIGAQYTNPIVKGTLIKFVAPAGYHFDSNSNLVLGAANIANRDKPYIFAAVVTLIYDGTNSGLGNFADGTGPVSLNVKVPSGAVIDEYIPTWSSSFTGDTTQIIVAKILANENFGLYYDLRNTVWSIVSTGLSTTAPFNETTNPWLIRFDYSGGVYRVFYRSLKYVIESELQTRFFFDSRLKVFDSRTGKLVIDQVKVLQSNPQPGSGIPFPDDQICQVYAPVIESDGYINTSRIEVSYADSNNDGIADDPDFFENIVYSKSTSTTPDLVARTIPFRGYIKTSLVFYKRSTDQYSYVRWTPLKKDYVQLQTTFNAVVAIKNQYLPGQLFYATATGVMYQSRKTGTSIELTDVTEYYQVREGRQNLFFQYKHNSPQSSRIDPSPTNVIDLYIMTKQYDTDYRLWIQDSTGKVVKPELPSAEELALAYSSLDQYKMTSDSIIYNSAKYKPIFGIGSDPSLRAVFKVVKNVNSLASDAEIKSGLISAVNRYFSIDNWDFGEPFYFTEMVAYLHQQLSSTVSSIVLVPLQSTSRYGALQQINAEPDEILISSARVDDVVIITSITAVQLNSSVSNV
jgi:hypothetical protein